MAAGKFPTKTRSQHLQATTEKNRKGGCRCPHQEDMQHVIAGKQLLIRRAAGAASKSAAGIAYRSRSLFLHDS